MKHLIVVVLISIYVFLSAFLESGPVGRVALADLYLLLIIVIAFALGFVRNSFYLPSLFFSAVPMFLVFLFGGVFAAFPDRVAFELLVILFSFFGAIAISNLVLSLPEIWVQRFFVGYALAIGLISALCLIDFFIFPGLVSSRQLGGIQGPFRNTGQAGSFFGVHSALLLAMLLSKVLPRSLPYLAITSLALLALVFTLKRASIIAVVAGIFFLAVKLAFSQSAKDKKISFYVLTGILTLGLIGFTLFDWALEAVPGLKWRWEYKFSATTVEDFSEGFFAENIRSTMAAFADRPLFGVGLDNVRDVYQHHEIHSTYLGILAYGGLAGIVAYIFFMSNLFRLIWREARYKRDNAWAAFLYYFSPLLLGQMIGWAYTIHIRKREFWILVILIVVSTAWSRRNRIQATNGDCSSQRQVT